MQELTQEEFLNRIETIKRSNEPQNHADRFSNILFLTKTEPKERNIYFNPLTEFPVIRDITESESKKLDQYNSFSGWRYFDSITFKIGQKIKFNNEDYLFQGKIDSFYNQSSIFLKKEDKIFKLQLTSENVRSLYIENADISLTKDLKEVKDEEIFNGFKNSRNKNKP